MTQSSNPSRDISILVIDDDQCVASTLSDYLQDEGYSVRSESSGESGLAAFGRERSDIVITDLRMPGIDGLEVVRRVKAAQPDCEVIVITGYATIQDGVEAMRHGAYDFLLKPVKVAQIDAVLNRCSEWLRHQRSHAELQEVNRRLLELNQMKQRFLAVTDHELRTPVAVLDGTLQLLARQAGDLPDPLRGRLRAVQQVSRRLSNLVRDIHDVVQSQDHSFAIQLDQASVGDLTRGVELDFEMARFNREVELALHNDADPDLVFTADAHRLRQALTELIQNAVKATADGGRVEVRVAVSENSGDPRLQVAVSDTGVGIPPEEQKRIFEIFYSLGSELHHHTSKFDYMGSGLGIGLSIALEIAAAHGGGLELESQAGEGSTFTLWVPLAPPA